MTRTSALRYLPLSSLVLAIAASPLLAQTSKGILVGVARDKTGATLSNATVTIKDQATGAVRTAQTKPDGAYRFDALDPDPYTLRIESAGFQTQEVKNVQVKSTVVTSYDLSVAVSSASSEVTVEADNATLNTENGQLAGVINAAEIDKLPIFSLNPVELALTVPGVQPVTQGADSNGENIQVNGARPRANNFLVDGQEINDVSLAGQAFSPQIPDVFQSETVITNSADAEYGRAGGGIVNLTTKAGTNQYHGSVFERYAGSGLQSVLGNERGQPGITNTRQDTHSYGFTGGGAILRDKLFAFGALELQRTYGNETPGINLLPDPAGYALLQTITGAPAAQVKLLDQYLSNGAYLTQDRTYYLNGAPGTPVKKQNVGALPGCPAGGCIITFDGYQRPIQPLNSPDTQWTTRVDYQAGPKDEFSYRYLHNRSSLTPDFFNNPNALQGFDTYQGGPGELAQGAWTHIFTPNLVNELRGSEGRISYLFAPTAATAANPLYALPTFTFANLSGTSAGGAVTFPALGPNQNFPQGRREDLYQIQDTISWTRGIQTIRAGVDLGRLIEIDVVSQNAKGTLAFVNGGSGVYSLGNFLLNQLGPSGTATVTFGPTRGDSHGYRNGVFAQDDIKFSADLTVNLGFRYDYLTNPENSLPYPGINPSNVFAPINTVVPINTDKRDLSPRLGFAYSPHHGGFFADGKSVIRGGFGIFYDSTFSNILVNSLQSAPNAVAGLATSTTGNGLANATSLIPTISPNLLPSSSVLSELSNTVNPLTYQYNLGVERELPGQVVLGVRYVGSRGEHLFANQQFNYFNGLTGQRLNPARGPITARGNVADSNYNGAEISASHSFRGLNIRANYTYSKNLSDGDDIFAVGSPTSYTANLAPGGRRQDWSNSAFDHRQFFSIAYVYSPRGFHASNKFEDFGLDVLTRHWTVSGVTQLQSGQYTTIAINGLDVNGDGSSANDRPSVANPSAPFNTVGVDGYWLGATPGVYYDLVANNQTNALNPVNFNQVHFVVPHDPNNSFLQSEIGRNSLLSPGSTYNNIALEKGIGLAPLHFERGTFILRAEAQDFPNHNDSVIGDSSILDAGVGFNQTSRAASQRTVILWGKLVF